MRLGALGLPGWDGGGVQAIANSHDNPTNNKVRQSKRSALQGSSYNHNNGAGKNGLSTAEDISNPDTTKGTEEAAQIVGRHSNA